MAYVNPYQKGGDKHVFKIRENLNDDTNQTVEASENAGMNEQDKIALDKIGKLQGAQFQHCEMTETAGTELFRLQVGSHGGSSVFSIVMVRTAVTVLMMV
ncbi:hypothetical protein O5259_25735 [Escherichia coli]|nr:hypothetical protein [Escherichia coli]